MGVWVYINVEYKKVKLWGEALTYFLARETQHIGNCRVNLQGEGFPKIKGLGQGGSKVWKFKPLENEHLHWYHGEN